MRIYTQAPYTGSYRSNVMTSDTNKNSFLPSSNSNKNSSFPSIVKKKPIVLPPQDEENSENFYRSNATASNTNKNSFLPTSHSNKNSSFPSISKKKSIVLPQDEENSENFENSNAPIANTRPSTAPALQKGLSCRTLRQPIPEGGACNLVYEPDSSGRLVEHYTTHELQGMALVGRWTAGAGKKIAGFKFKRNVGRNVLIGNCSAGVLGRRNYCNGFCQFVKQAKLMKGDVTLYDVPTGFKAMPVDVYLYYDDNRPGHQTVKLLPGKSYTTENILAVGCVPKNTRFYESEKVDLLKWLHGKLYV